jgi:protoporphyrinogen oxidase
MKKSVSILGGGPAGLAAGYYAAKKGLDFRVFEAAGRMGGMCATLSFGDFHFDLGAHRFHDQDEAVTRDITELMGDSLHQIDIGSHIYSEGRLIDFPLAPFNLIKSIGLPAALKSGAHLAVSRLVNRAGAFHDFERFTVYKYGRPVAARFLLNYSEKLWGLPCSRLSTEVSGKRLKGLSLTQFLMETFAFSGRRSRHLDGAFYYPGKGFGGIVERLASAIGDERCLVDKKVTRIHHKNGLVRSVELNHAENVPADRVVSTLPLPHFLELLEPACPNEISALADGLNYRRLILVMLFLNVDSVTRSGTVYFPGSEFPFNRVSEPKNRSPFMAPPGKTSLIAEIPCGRDESPDEERRVQTVVQKLSQIGWMREEDVFDSRVVVMDHAYPVLDVDHGDKLVRIMEYLRSYKNLDLIGRNSLFKYIHFHDIMRSAREWAEARAV